MLDALRERNEWRFFGTLARADRGLAVGWWLVLLLRGLLPAFFAVAAGAMVGAVERGGDLVGPMALVAAVFVPMQVLPPLHRVLGANLGSRTAAWLYDRLTIACVRPPGMGHLENAKLTSDLTMARDFDLAITGPPMAISMDFIASGLVEMTAGLASAAVLAGYAWWAPLVLAGAWLATHWLLRESGVWRDRNTAEVRAASRCRLRVSIGGRAARGQGAAAFRSCRLGGRPFSGATAATFRPSVGGHAAARATGALERALGGGGQHRGVLVDRDCRGRWNASARRRREIRDGRFAQQHDRLRWPIVGTRRRRRTGGGGLAAGESDGSRRGAGFRRREFSPPVPPASQKAPEAHLRRPARGMPAHEIRFRDVTFAYPETGEAVLEGFDLVIPAGSSLAIVGQNGAGKTTLAKLLCRLYDPQAGAILIDGVDLRELDLVSWRLRVAAVFQDFIRFELPLRDNVAPAGAPDEVIRAAIADAGAAGLAELDTVLARGYEGGTELSGGQWQRVALARALCAVGSGAGVVLLDEPTAQLDVRGEAEIFDRILTATRRTTTILISHRFSTVRHADRICVLEAGRVVELGTHDELMSAGGRYRTMFDLQASRFGSDDDVSQGMGNNGLA